jgi:hypothetical protein
MSLGHHRTTKVPAPNPPARPTAKAPAPNPPARPTVSPPENRDYVNAHVFGDEFDTIPLPNQTEAKASAPVCNATNMEFIRSTLPIPIHFEFEQFFERMAKQQWSAALPSQQAFRDRAGLGRAVPMGLHRPSTRVDASIPLHRGASATDWKKIRELDRVSAYVFRGDQRRTTDIRAANGFHPPSARTDDHYLTVIAKRFVTYMKQQFSRDVDLGEVVQYIKGQGPVGKVFVQYEIWRAVLESEKFHIGRMTADEFLRGYVSTSRDINIAAGFAKNNSAGGTKGPVYAIYALHSEGGFLLPNTKHAHSTNPHEAEIAHPGSIPWCKVMAFRTGTTLDPDDARTFDRSGVIFVRKDFHQADPRGFAKVIASLGSLPYF